MSVNDEVTNESLNKRFDNPFALVNYAIQIARDKIGRGEIDSSNLANEILEILVNREDLIGLEEKGAVEEVTK